jgi:hypothetical protein
LAVKTFKLSNDPRFEEKLIDGVGLYLNPPEKAVVLCMDEKTSIQALDHTRASRKNGKVREWASTLEPELYSLGCPAVVGDLWGIRTEIVGGETFWEELLRHCSGPRADA